MIDAEGYIISISCDTKGCGEDLRLYGPNKEDAWALFRLSEWVKTDKETYCPTCAGVKNWYD